jgi:DegV family protein with EDD domain
MPRVAIVTDSTAYLPQELVQRHHIHVIPLNLLFGQESYLDNVDIGVNEFYDRLSKLNGDLPTTSQPSAGAFRDLYQKVARDADEIVSLHISSDLSGTVTSAMQAKAMLPDIPIHVVDSRLTTMALGYMALAAARVVEAGGSAVEAAAAAEALIPRIKVYFAVDTMRYLHMGGRIGGGAVFLGTALDIKPILELANGKIEAAGKVRSMKRAIPKVVDMLVDEFGEGARVRAATIGAACPETAQAMADQMRKKFDCVELYVSDLSPVIGAHVGPGTVGALAFPA